MSLWFDRENQEKILLKYLPVGKSYRQAFVEGSNFNNLIKWISFNFQRLVDKYNRTFKGLYVCESDYLVERWKADYNIPSNVFYLSKDENKIDVFVLRYLMRGNTKWHFQAIANIYGVDVVITNARDFFKNSRLPNGIPHKLYAGVEDMNNVLVVNFLTTEYDTLPHSIPHKLGGGMKLEKIKKIYQVIKQAQCKILYLSARAAVGKDEKINFCKGVK